MTMVQLNRLGECSDAFDASIPAPMHQTSSSRANGGCHSTVALLRYTIL